MTAASKHLASAFLSVLALLGFTRASAETIYDNTYRYSDAWYPSTSEYGDDALFSGQARTITDFLIEYYCESAFIGAARARIRFYAPDGPGLSPQTLLYQSEPIPVYPEYNVIHLRGLSVPVGSAIIWTIQFEGLIGVYPERAGLVLYHPPALGTSYSDFWVKSRGQWETRVLQQSKANFAVRILAQPDPSVQIVSNTEEISGARSLQVQGPNFEAGEIWVSDDMTQWSLLSTVPFLGGPAMVRDGSARAGIPRFYRANLANHLVWHLSFLRQTNEAGVTEKLIRAAGPPGTAFVLESTFDFKTWLPVPLEPQFLTSGICDVINPPGASGGVRLLFYQGLGADEIPVVLGESLWLPEGRAQMLVKGPPGRDCEMQVSSDLVHWRAESTNSFSFTSRTFTYVTPPVTHGVAAYYRALLVPLGSVTK